MIARSKKWLIAGIIGALALTAPLYSPGIRDAVSPGQVYAAEASETSQRIITVTGQGELTVTPDVAYIHLGIRTEAPTANEAQKKNAEAFKKLEKVLYEDYKLDKKNVKTTNFYVNPEYSYTDRDPVIKGYSATQMLQVTYRDLDGLGTFLDAVSAAGANQINGIDFGTEKSEEYELQAIEKALENAKVKAEAIAKYAGKELKGIVSVTQGGGVAVPLQRANLAMEAKMAADSANAATSISVGQIKVTTQVTVQYEF